jgi:peptidoglycan-associated lipoprotein
MFRITIITVVIAGLLFVSACNRAKKEPVKSAQHIDAIAARPAQPAYKSEAAQGKIKEAMLALRRVHFAYNSAKLLPGARKAIAGAASRLKAHPDVAIYVAGHCDERGSVDYNHALGERRAEAVVKELIRQGIPEKQLTVVSYGKDRPQVNGSDAKSYATNRRVEFEIIRGNVRIVVEPGTLYDDKGHQMKI